MYYWPINKSGDKYNLLEEVVLKLELKLDMGDIREDPVEMEKLWGHFLKSVRDRRSKTKCDYYVNKPMARQNKPSYLDQEKWNNLCDYWGTKGVQEIAQTNAENRSDVQNLNTEGSAAYVCIYQEKKAQQESGELSKMGFFLWMGTKDTGVWKNPHKKEQYEEMVEIVESSRDSDNPVSEDDAFHMVLGYGSGYCHGLGYGQSPPSRKRDRVEINYAQLFADNQKLNADKEKLQDRCENLEDRVSQLNEKQVESDQQVAVANEKLTRAEEELAEFRRIVNILKVKGIV